MAPFSAISRAFSGNNAVKCVAVVDHYLTRDGLAGSGPVELLNKGVGS